MNLKKIIKVFVNLITTSRLIFSIVLAFLHFKINKYRYLLIITSLFFTDFIDGFLARKFEVQSYYGSTMDTIADKALNIVVLLPLLSENKIAIIILIEEIAIALINIYSKIKGKHTRSSIFGKIKMWFLAISVILGYLFILKNIPLIIVNICFILTIILEFIVILEYYFYLKKQKSKKNYKKIDNTQGLIYMLFSTEYYKENILAND